MSADDFHETFDDVIRAAVWDASDRAGKQEIDADEFVATVLAVLVGTAFEVAALAMADAKAMELIADIAAQRAAQEAAPSAPVGHA
jgi:hypothetical protein